jgi:hypothetical protein
MSDFAPRDRMEKDRIAMSKPEREVLAWHGQVMARECYPVEAGRVRLQVYRASATAG